MLPWGGGVDLRGQRVQGVDQLIHLLQSGLRDREIPCELASFTVSAYVDGVALAVPAKSFFAELGQQIFERILVGGDPLRPLELTPEGAGLHRGVGNPRWWRESQC
ncbi:Uncharacterised protein [Mycobacteroides abscessus subsp. abscessus]|nr:Uncharacterised protein [Mycobacteroides abscessus subsp. abscessus]